MSPNQALPHAYVMRHLSGHGGITRFFFTENLTYGLVREFIRKINTIPGVHAGEGVRPYDHYIAVQWSTYVLPEDMMDEDIEDTAERIEDRVIHILSEAFGWDEPIIEDLYSLQDLRATAEQRGVLWQLGTI